MVLNICLIVVPDVGQFEAVDELVEHWRHDHSGQHRLNHHERDAGDKAAVAHLVRHARLQSRHLETDGYDLYVTA